MNNTNKIPLLIIKEKLGELDSSEAIELEKWRSKLGNKKIYEELCDSKYFIELYNDYRYLKSRKGDIKNNIKGRITVRKLFRLSKYAAAILLPLAVLYTFSLKLRYDNNRVAFKSNNSEIIMKSPVLRLSDGGKIILDEKMNSSSIPDSNIAINRSLREIRYSGKSNSQNNAVKINILDIPKCCEYKVYLSDGTLVYLNAMSRLKYPEKFIGDKRVVELEGEGYFEVAKDSKRPFLVKTKNQIVRVLGTKFNINSYSSKIFTTLVEGSVQVSVAKLKGRGVNSKQILSPGMQSIIDDSNIRIQKVNVNDYVAWINGEFIFRRQSLDNILTSLGRWYDFEVFYANNELKDRLFSVKVKKFKRPEELFNLLEKAYDVEFELKRKSLTVRKKYK